MNNRIVAWAAVACLSACASSAGAVALGEMRALSALGEPLRLRLALTDLAAVNPADVSVILAPADDYARLGLIPPLGAEQWQVAMRNDNGLSALISSDAVPQDPNLSFLVQLIWPGNMRVQQVTAVLLPAVVSAAEPVMVIPTLPQAVPDADEPSAGAASVVVAPAPAASVDGKAAGIEEIAAEPATARVKSGDTLSGLARGWYLPKATLQQRQQVLASSNPQMFIAGNINLLKRGAVIRYPLAHGVTLPDARQAAEWLAARQTSAAADNPSLDAPALSAQPASDSTAADQEVTLTLVNPGSISKSAQASGDEAEAASEMSRLLARKNALLAERAALQAELKALEASGSRQDARLKVLDARLAQLNAPSTPAASAPSASPDEAGSPNTRWVAVAVGLLLALLLVLRRRAAAATAAATASQPVPPPENDYVAFEPLEALPVPAWRAESPEATVPEASHPASVAGDPDEEYDFLSDAESAALQTRLDLAQAYIDMQETELARELLSAVVSRGNASQRAQASSLLASLA